MRIAILLSFLALTYASQVEIYHKGDPRWVCKDLGKHVKFCDHIPIGFPSIVCKSFSTSTSDRTVWECSPARNSDWIMTHRHTCKKKSGSVTCSLLTEVSPMYDIPEGERVFGTIIAFLLLVAFVCITGVFPIFIGDDDGWSGSSWS